MTLLPIVERELRVAARRRGTYWSRMVMATVAILIGASVVVAKFGVPNAILGQIIFIGLAVLAFIYSLAAGRRSTADCISEEKREGTLGLLFLTDLSGYDVVLGKLVATSLNAFYGLLAVFPVLALPMLLGGVSNGQFWRLVLVLVNTFLFSLAIGMFSSSVSYDARKALALNFALLFFFTIVLPACAGVLEWAAKISLPQLCFTSPICCFFLALDLNYKTTGHAFWWSLAVIHGLVWLLLIQSSRVVPRSWQDKPAPSPRTAKARRQSFGRAWNYGNASELAAYRKKLLDVNAFYWLAARARRKPVHVWVFLGFLFVWWMYIHFEAGQITDDFVNVVMALLITTTVKLWFALEAVHRLAEDKKIGALELVLSTPLTVRDIIHGQMLALRRQFLAPAIFVIAMDLYLMAITEPHFFHFVHTGDVGHGEAGLLWLGGIVMFMADLVALFYVAMARAITSKTHNYAILSTVFYVLMLPWILFGIATVGVIVWYNLTWFTGGPVGEPTPHFEWLFWLSMVADIAFGLRARYVLLNEMRELASQRFVSAARPEKKARKPFKLSRKQMLRYAAACAVIIAGVWICWPKPQRRKPLPPVILPTILSHGTVRGFAGDSGALFVLPNGSLWHCGQTGNFLPITPSPERVGTNTWVQASCSYSVIVGIRNDGTLWEAGNQPGARRGEFVELDSGHDWFAVSTAGMHSCALKRDGTLWAWGNNNLGQLGTGTIQNEAKPVQVGTNSDWMAVCCNGAATLAIRSNGTLWAWGQAWGAGFYAMGTAGVMSRLPAPTQICRETNWDGFANSVTLPLAHNTKGELWQPFYGPPSAEIGAAANCHLIASNLTADHVAFAYCGDTKIFEIRADGTLWNCDYSAAAIGNKTPGKWRQVGRRSDWISLWSGGETAFGLTADGTIWTWGIDLRHEIATDFSSRLKMLQARLASAGVITSKRRMSGYVLPQQYWEDPQPLLEMKGSGVVRER